jgi:protein-tyrosine phosphatase
MARKHATHAPFAVLFVCSGNICRSPFAEQIFRAQSDDIAKTRFNHPRADAWVTFASAGVWARSGDAMTEQAAELSARYGGDPTEHSSQLLTTQLVEAADLVLGLTREHRREIVKVLPRASRYTFTLTEFARLFENLSTNELATRELRALHGEPEFLVDVVEYVASRRGMVQPSDPTDDDVVDPYRRSQATYELSGMAISEAMTSIFASLEAVARG